jgi:hypothetical protein
MGTGVKWSYYCRLVDLVEVHAYDGVFCFLIFLCTYSTIELSRTPLGTVLYSKITNSYRMFNSYNS